MNRVNDIESATAETLCIDGAEWTIEPIRGRQLLNGVECRVIIHADRHAIAVSDSFPLREQIRAVAKAVLMIAN